MDLGPETENKHVRLLAAVTLGCSAWQAVNLNLKSRVTGVF